MGIVIVMLLFAIELYTVALTMSNSGCKILIAVIFCLIIIFMTIHNCRKDLVKFVLLTAGVIVTDKK